MKYDKKKSHLKETVLYHIVTHECLETLHIARSRNLKTLAAVAVP